jgi:isoquinoline 1-oxidoreductase alpha subunit
MPVQFSVNGKAQSLEVDPQMPVLWVLRDVLNLTGTKFGCGVSQCGACTVIVDGAARRACVLPVANVAGRDVRTIEGLGAAGTHALQQAWIEHQVPQCGYCQSGMLMAAAALLERNTKPTRDDIAAAITNICRCGTYPRVERAIVEAAAKLRAERK